MSIKIVRIPSETPNISNIDDFTGLLYAYGNQNGYVIDKGNECSYTINGSIFKINSGRLVLQGIECDIDANGIDITVDNVATKRYYSVYLQINLALNEIKILSVYDTATYPMIDIGDNLTQNTTGTARMILYNFDAINGVISNIQKIIESIKYNKDVFVENSKRVNGLEIKEESGVLKNNNKTIIQEELLWSNNTPANSADLSSFNLSAGDMLRIEYVEVREESSSIVGSRFKDIRLRPANQFGNLYEGAEKIITTFANMKLYLFSMNIAFEKGTLFFNYGGDSFTIIDISNGTSTGANTPYLGMVNIWKINEI